MPGPLGVLESRVSEGKTFTPSCFQSVGGVAAVTMAVSPLPCPGRAGEGKVASDAMTTAAAARRLRERFGRHGLGLVVRDSPGF